ncbi:hypothetical protein LTR56_020129 [Elasticomyces elasticus]|nr:hypothetical protein LTR56_020129 [Elasticomyces elasticus]KAK3633591.1 hypothetical protein LTR22_020027 [Elasticomyces elasticus]KAK4910800.1 hypothetical protein LTR49_020574 [Elasticomyces elasticus]KAK5760438.1 hypothetical protein LTS12_009482 [Elasticomyces elasticus]
MRTQLAFLFTAHSTDTNTSNQQHLSPGEKIQIDIHRLQTPTTATNTFTPISSTLRAVVSNMTGANNNSSDPDVSMNTPEAPAYSPLAPQHPPSSAPIDISTYPPILQAQVKRLFYCAVANGAKLPLTTFTGSDVLEVLEIIRELSDDDLTSFVIRVRDYPLRPISTRNDISTADRDTIRAICTLTRYPVGATAYAGSPVPTASELATPYPAYYAESVYYSESIAQVLARALYKLPNPSLARYIICENEHQCVGTNIIHIYELTCLNVIKLLKQTETDLALRDLDRIGATKYEAELLFTGWWDACSRMPYGHACRFTTKIYKEVCARAHSPPNSRLCCAILSLIDQARDEVRVYGHPAWDRWALGHVRVGV